MIHHNHHRHHDAIRKKNPVIFDHSLGTLDTQTKINFTTTGTEDLCVKMSELTLKLTNKKRKEL